MKNEQESIAQYTELVDALLTIGADWIIAEVEEVVSRGRAVQFRELSPEESALYETRLNEESRSGVPVGRAKADDFIGVPYSPHEQLTLLVDAIERVVITSERSHAYVTRLTKRLGIVSLELTDPIAGYLSAEPAEQRTISLTAPSLMNERLSILHHVLYNEVLA
jgi:hypothetical protein